jgi:adenylyltransferase/sulfurtransferase
VLGPIVNVIASLQAAETIKLLSGNRETISRTLNVIDVWDSRMRQVSLKSLREDSSCLTCQQREFPWLTGKRGSHSAVLCGRNAVQLSRPGHTEVALESLAQKLAPLGVVRSNPFLLRVEVDKYLITVFPDGRTIVAGTEDISEAKTVHAKYIGS